MRPDESLGPKFLLYHDVAAVAGGDEALARSRFERHIAAVAHAGYRFVPMSAFVAGERLGPRDAIVTVDDGATSFDRVVWPVLKEHGALPTLFILTGFMGLHGAGVDFFDWPDLTRLAEQGVEIGCHGVGHVPFDQIAPEAMRSEIAESTAALRAHGFEPTTLAYPFGRYDEATKAAVRDAGYSAAFSVLKGGFDRFEIRRRLFTGVEGAALTRFTMSDAFFDVRERVRAVTPRRFLKQEQPVVPERWGPAHFGVKV